MTQEEQLMAYAKAVLGADRSGHNMDHIRRVVATTKTLLAKTPAADRTVAVAAATLVSFFMLGKAGDEALMRGFAIGWMVSVLVHSGMSGYYGLQEKWYGDDD